MRFALLAAAGLAASGCTVVRAVGPFHTVPRARADECAAGCAALDMRLSAMVLVMNHAGCVCEPRGGSPGPTAAAAVAGGATIQAIVQQQQQQHQQQGAANSRPSQGPSSR